MRKALLPYLLAATFGLTVWLSLNPTPADAQLVVVTRRYKVLGIDPDKSVIKVGPVDKDGESADVIVTSETRMFVFDQLVPNFSWHLLRKGMKITVHGGATWDLRVKARKIYLMGGSAPG